MAGDHAPSFVSHVADKSIAPENDLQLLERSTPYIIWANYPLENAGQTSETDPLNRIDMCTLAPVVAEQAGLPLTPFYRYLLAMREYAPVYTGGQRLYGRRGRNARVWRGRRAGRVGARVFRTGIQQHRHPCAAQPGAVQPERGKARRGGRCRKARAGSLFQGDPARAVFCICRLRQSWRTRKATGASPAEAARAHDKALRRALPALHGVRCGEGFDRRHDAVIKRPVRFAARAQRREGIDHPSAAPRRAMA